MALTARKLAILDPKAKLQAVGEYLNTPYVLDRILFAYYRDGHHWFVNNGSRLDYFEALLPYRGTTNWDTGNRALNIYTRTGKRPFDEEALENIPLAKTNFCKTVVDAYTAFTVGSEQRLDAVPTDSGEFVRGGVDVMKEAIAETHRVFDVTPSVQLMLDVSAAYTFGSQDTKLYFSSETGKGIIRNLQPVSVVYDESLADGKVRGVTYMTRIALEDAINTFPDFAPQIEDSVSKSMQSGVIRSSDVTYFEIWDYESNRVQFYVNTVNVTGDKGLLPYGDVSPFDHLELLDGKSILADIIALNDSYNILSTYAAISEKYHSFPYYTVTMLKDWQGNKIPLDQKDLEALKVIKANTIAGFPITRIAAEGCSPTLLEMLEKVISDISRVSGLPSQLMTGEINGVPSGTAIKRMLSLLLARVEATRTLYSKFYVQRLKKMMLLVKRYSPTVPEYLAQLGEEEITNAQLELVYAPVLEEDPQEVVARMTSLDDFISKKTIVEELGYDWESEREQRDEERADTPMELVKNGIQQEAQQDQNV